MHPQYQAKIFLKLLILKMILKLLKFKPRMFIKHRISNNKIIHKILADI